MTQVITAKNRFTKKPIFATLVTCMTVLTLMFSGCSKHTDTKSTADKSAIADNNDLNQKDTTIAAMLSEGFFLGYNLSIDGGNLPDTKKTCLTSIDKLSATAPLQALLEKELTTDELNELNAFYATDIGKRFIKFGKEQAQIMLGNNITPTVTLSDAEKAKIFAYMNTESAKKLMRFNGGEDQIKMIHAVTPTLVKHAESCGISKAELNLPE